jgi:hypothetical protein
MPSTARPFTSAVSRAGRSEGQDGPEEIRLHGRNTATYGAAHKSLSPFCFANRAKRVSRALGIPAGRFRDAAILNGTTVFEIMNAAEKVAPGR